MAEILVRHGWLVPMKTRRYGHENVADRDRARLKFEFYCSKL